MTQESARNISAKEVKALRDATGAGMMDAKRALTDAQGNFEEAAEMLKRRGLAKAADRLNREANEGAVAIAAAEGAAALVHLRSETDFSAKSEDFLTCLQEIAEAVLVDGPLAGERFTERIDDLRLSKKENITLGSAKRLEAAEDNLLDTYLHIQDGRGVNGVIVEGAGVPADVLHQVSLHAAFAKPSYLHRSEVDEEELERQRASAAAMAEGRPPQAREKIIEGRLKAWYAERVLLEQGLHGDKLSVQETLKGGRIVRFEQSYLG